MGWRLRHREGHWLHVESVVSDLRDDPDVQGVVLTSRDATQRRALEEQLRHRAFHDPLTQLANRALFHDRVEQALRRAKRQGSVVSLVLCDIDDFKVVNDTLGHAGGDEVLIAKAAELCATLRSVDTAARLGGDEFGVLLEGLGDVDEAVEIAERLLQAVRTPIEVHGHPVRVSSSVGVAVVGAAEAPPAEDLMCQADVALYGAKRAGKNRVELYFEGLADAVGDPGRGRGDDVRPSWLRRAEAQRAEVLSLLDREDGARSVFQPIVSLAEGRVVGYEALARFGAHVDRSPTLWFAQAHRCGLGGRLEAAAVRAALGVGPAQDGAYVALNLSPSALLSRDVRHTLPDDLSSIVVEVTENELVSGGDALRDALATLRRRGARIAIDDAGAGYAGFAQLVRLRPDIIKVDRSIIDGVDADPFKAALVECFVRLGQQVGASVLAEGVETISELEAVHALGVSLAQGYLLARPGPPWTAVDAAALTRRAPLAVA